MSTEFSFRWLPRDNAGGALRRGGRRPARPSRRRDEQPLGRGFAPRVDRDAKRDRDGPRRSDRQPRVLAALPLPVITGEITPAAIGESAAVIAACDG